MQSLNLVILRGTVTQHHLISHSRSRGQAVLSFRLATCERWGRSGFLHHEYHQLLLRDSGGFRKYSQYGRHVREGALLLAEGVLRHHSTGGSSTFIDCLRIVPQQTTPSAAESAPLTCRDLPALQKLSARPELIHTLCAAGLSAEEIRVLCLLLQTTQVQLQAQAREEQAANDTAAPQNPHKDDSAA